MASVNTRGKYLFFDFRYRGVRCREYTKLEDTVANRRKADKLLRRIEAEIELNQFDYRKYFPNSKMAARFDQPPQSSSATPRFKEFAEQWFNEIKVTYRESHRVTIRTHIDKHLVPGLPPLRRHLGPSR